MFLSVKRFNEILRNLKGRKIAVIGDVMLDRYYWGDVERISPEAPVPVVKLNREEIRIGGAANVADNIAVIGGRPVLISVIGGDPAGREFLEYAEKLELDVGNIIIDRNRPTTVKTRIIARHQQVCRVDKEVVSDIDETLTDSIIAKFAETASQTNAVIISDYGKGLITPRLVRKIIDLCREKAIFVVVDPKEHHWEYYHGVDLIKPNHHETASATNIKIDSEQALENAGRRLLEITGANAALITTGERGMSLFEGEKPVKHLPTMAKDVFDVTGAGDTVTAVAAAFVAAGATLKEAAITANHAAGIVVAEVGTAAATPEKIEASMARERNKSLK